MSTFHFASADGSWHLTGRVHDLSIPLQFNGAQPNHYGAKAASARPMQSGDFVGDTRHGGSCNAAAIELNPHCNGTHTECVGHLTGARINICDLAPTLPVLAAVTSITPAPAAGGKYRSDDAQRTSDMGQIDEQQMDAAITDCGGAGVRALIVRTLPNTADKLTRIYTGEKNSPWFTASAIARLVEAGIEHLLVDTPSIDKYYDQGRLSAHRVFFGLPPYEDCPLPEARDASRTHATITEMIYVPDDVTNGIYLLNLQIPSFCLDAAPSRPLLYELEMT